MTISLRGRYNYNLSFHLVKYQLGDRSEQPEAAEFEASSSP
jgi:hypothetical protein